MIVANFRTPSNNMKRRLIRTGSFLFAAMLMIVSAPAADSPTNPEAESVDNLLDNGGFEEGLDGWSFILSSNQKDDSGAALPAKGRTEELLSWEKGGAQGSKGCLKVTMPPAEKPALTPWSTGAVCGWRTKIGTAETIRVSFEAKGAEGGEILALSCLYGAAPGTKGGGSVTLESGWKKFEVLLGGPWKNIVFALVTPQGNCDEGDFWIDNVVVSITDSK